MFYLVLVVIVLQMTPNDGYRKYIRFCTGLILILLLSGPILKIADMQSYPSDTLEEKWKELEELIEDEIQVR